MSTPSQSDESTPKARPTSFPAPSSSYQAFQLPTSTSEGSSLHSHTPQTTSTSVARTTPYLDVRPSLGNRSVSSPPTEFLTTSTSQVSELSGTSKRGPNSFISEISAPNDASPHRGRERWRKNRKPSTTDKKEWTVFGQLMEGHRVAVSSAATRSASRPGRNRHLSPAVTLPTGGSTSSNIVPTPSRQRADRLTLQPTSSSSTFTFSPRSSRPINTQNVPSPPRSFVPSSGLLLSARHITEEPFPVIHAHEGEEALVAHHRLGTEVVGTRPPSHYDTGGTKTKKPSSRSPSPSQSSHSESSDTDEEASEDASPRPSTIVNPAKRKWFFFTLPTLTVLQRNVLKCGLAYFFASLFTLVPYLASFISDISSFGHGHGKPSPSAHLIATVTVYFNPAKTTGAMFEADLFCLIGVLFSAVMSLSSSFSIRLFEDDPDYHWIGDSLAFIWVAVAMSIVAWAKVWVNKPSFNTATSMTSIILFIVIVKEGGFRQLVQVTFNVFIGSIISNVVCFSLWPQSATRNLQRDMTTSLESYATLLDMHVRTFLLDPQSRRGVGKTRLQRAVEAHQKSFTSLKTNLDEARSEWALNPPDPPLKERRLAQRKQTSALYGEAVDSLTRLGQHLAGLRGGTRLQIELSAAHRAGRITLPNKRASKDILQEDPGDSSQAGSPPAKNKDKEKERVVVSVEDEEDAILAAAAQMFGDLVDDVGPPMTALTTTCISTLKKMRGVFLQLRSRQSLSGENDQDDFHELAFDIKRALFTFEHTSNHAVMRLYRRSTVSDTSSITSDMGHEDGETIFLVYFFIFTLQEFAQELILLVDIMSQLHDAEQEAQRYRGPWGWLQKAVNRIAQTIRTILLLGKRESMHRPSFGTKQGVRKTLRRKFSNLVPLEPRYSPKSAFPKIHRHTPNTAQTPARSTLDRYGRLQRHIWDIFNRLKEGDLRYSFKVGVSTAILAIPAFIDSTRPIFLEWRGEWALISFFVVMGQTIGATNFLSIHRILGTIFGAAVATIAFSISHKHPAVLAIFGFLFSLPCFHYIVSSPQYATTGRFVLLTYNLTCLFCFNVRDKKLSVIDVAIGRSIAVAIGVIWAVIVSRVWWPAEARRELGVALSDFLLNIGWLYNRLVLTYSIQPHAPEPMSFSEEDYGAAARRAGDADPELEPVEQTRLLRPALVTDLNTNIREFMSMELHLQIKLLYIQKLLAQAQNEPRLKGPFPVGLYRSILTSLQRILDLLHSMRCVTTREEWYTSVRRDFIIPVKRERREMVGNVILFFFVLSSAFQLKKPLPPYLPPAEESRERLVYALKNLDIVKQRRVQTSRQLLYFAYAMMMKGVIQELEYLGTTLQDAFGVIGQTMEQFESLFVDTESIANGR